MKRRSHAPVTAEIRPANVGDLLPCARIFVRAAADLGQRMGHPPARRSAAFMAHRLAHVLRTDPKGFQVAVQGSRIVAFATTILRERVHFLGMFWALPSLQGRGVGRELLRRAFDEPQSPRGANRCVYASLDPRAQRLYLGLGMLPRMLVYGISGAISTPPGVSSELVLEALNELGRPSPEALSLAARVDREIRGCARDADQAFVLAQPGARLFAACRRGKRVGYVVIDGHAGSIGPGGTLEERDSGPLVSAALALAHDQGVEQVRVLVPGLNRTAVEAALAAGLHLSFSGAWMAQRELGRFDRYFAGYGDFF